MATTPFPEPASTSDLRGLFLEYLDFYRDVVIGRLEGLESETLQHSVVSSGWTAAGLLNHLAEVERRWMVWGFAGTHLDDPWRDAAGTEEGAGWVSPPVDASELAARLRRAGADTRRVAEAHRLTDRAAVGGRYTEERSAPQLQWVLLHLVQEYARHAGHLDIWRELHDGTVGEIGPHASDGEPQPPPGLP